MTEAVSRQYLSVPASRQQLSPGVPSWLSQAAPTHPSLFCSVPPENKQTSLIDTCEPAGTCPRAA